MPDAWNRDMAQAPRDGTDILIASASIAGGRVQVWWDEQRKFWVDIEGDPYADARAWQPLPEPPGDETINPEKTI